MKAIVVEGPSGVGKSQVAFALAKALGSEIVVADSAQLYKGFDIGANKPSIEMQREVRYHLLGKYNPRDFSIINPLTVWQYRSDALQVLQALWSRRLTPILEGGSHFYLKCLLFGKDDAGTDSIPQSLRTYAKSLIEPFRNNWDQCVEHVHKSVPNIDSIIGKNDFYRMEKAIVLAMMGKKQGRVLFTDNPQFDARVFYLDIDHPSLARSNANRCERLIDAGLVEETINLIVSGDFNVSESNEKLPEHSIGYTETLDYIRKLLQLIRQDHLRDEDLISAFYSYLERFFINTRRCVHYQRKTFRMSAKQGVFIPLMVDSFGEIPIANIVQSIIEMANLGEEQFAEMKGVDLEHFRSRLELEFRAKWKLYPRDSEHPTSALNVVYRHMKTLQLHRDHLTSLGL